VDVRRRSRRVRRVAGAKGPRRRAPRTRPRVVAGRIQGHPDGYGFLVPDDPAAEDIYLPRRGLRPAMHGDRAEIEVIPGSRRTRTTGRVVRVVERAATRLVGVLHVDRHSCSVVPHNRRIAYLVIVPAEATGGARDGDVVVAEITGYPTSYRDIEARVAATLGPADDPRVETEAVIHTYDLPTEFPAAVRREAARVPDHVPAAATGGRLDLRPLRLVTIDGENARDFDDAVGIEALGDGRMRLTVAVADVAAYVAPGAALDTEARARGTSVYFPDRVLPMLPEALSNGICSLVPGADRLVHAVRLEYAPDGGLLGVGFTEAAMCSVARLTYTEVAAMLVDGDPALRTRHHALVDDLERMEVLCRALMARRRARGSIDFDLPEAEIVLDLRGRPENIVRAERTIAHQMIEEFMLAANDAVARHLTRLGLPMLYRVHEPPAPDAMAPVTRFLESLGLRLQIRDGRPTPRAYQRVLERVAGRPEARVVNRVLLRSLSQARYATQNLGHFGLASDCYTHFTSPIRRYPDLIVHRILKTTLSIPASRHAQDLTRLTEALPAIAEDTSRRERVAMDAERDIVALKKVQLMQEKIGQTFAAFVSDVASFGFFVELDDLFVEGLVHVTTLGDDFYEHLEDRHCLRGRRRHRTFRIGDPVRVRLVGASVERRQIDFVLEDT
jgi:ribonuclease R